MFSCYNQIMTTPQNLKGFPDFLPPQMAIRKRVIAILEEVFTSFGFEPLQTPTLEYADVLMGKYGEEADKLLYLFEDRGGRKVGLNYDLTVPTARVLAQYQELPKPFKRYQIQPAYRAENTQKGRYRQFPQCDIDIFGSRSPLSDAEILTVISTSLQNLGFENFSILINSRPVLYSILEKLNVPTSDYQKVLQVVDKTDKLTPDQLDQELIQKNLPLSYTKQIMPLLNKAKPDINLEQVINLAISMGVPKDKLVFSPHVVRGLDYYTGTIFETIVKEPKIGSVTGGGRYDNLIKQLGGPDIPAVGTTIGLDRICDCIEELNLWKNNTTGTQVLVSIFSPEFLDSSLKLASSLRSLELSTHLYPDSDARLDKQLKYASKKGIPFVAIIGENEAKNNTAILKNMLSGEQKSYGLDNLENLKSSILNSKC